MTDLDFIRMGNMTLNVLIGRLTEFENLSLYFKRFLSAEIWFKVGEEHTIMRVCGWVCLCACLTLGNITSDGNNKRRARERKLSPHPLHKLFPFFFFASGPVEQLMKFKWSRIRRSSGRGSHCRRLHPHWRERNQRQLTWRKSRWGERGRWGWGWGLKYLLNVIISNHL